MSALRAIGALAWLNLQQLAADRTGLATLIVLPLMLTFLFGTMLGGGERRVVVAFADGDGTAVSRAVAGGLDPASYDVRRVGEETARLMASSGEAAASVIVPRGFSGDVLGGVDTSVLVVKDPRSTSALAVVEAVSGDVQRIAANGATIRVVSGAFRDASLASGVPQTPPPPDAVFAYADRLWTPEPPVSVRAVTVTASKVRGSTTGPVGFQQYSLGFTLMFMLFMALGSAGGFLEEREQGTLARLLTTPASRMVLVAGKIVGIYVTVLMEAAIMVGAGALFFHVPWGEDPLGVGLVLGSFALAATGLGVMATTLVRTRGQMSALTAVAATALAMLGGAYWPLDIVNPTMRAVALATPVGWAMTGLTDVVVRSQGASTAVLPATVLCGMALAFTAVGVSRLRLE